MNTLSDEMLMAYADGELNGAELLRVEQMVQQDAALAARVAKHRALRATLQHAFAPMLHEVVPARLAELLHAPQAQVQRDNVIPLQARAVSRRWQSREWLALAASLLAGVWGGYALQSNSSGDAGSWLANRAGDWVAQGELAQALQTQLAGDVGPVRTGISYRNRAGAYCRSFITSEPGMAGVACHEQQQWRIQLLGPAGAGGEYRQAASPAPEILALIERERVGEPLDAQAEAAARQSGW